VRRLLLAALLLALTAAPAAHAAPFKIAQGEDPGVALDDAGTAFVGWKLNPGAANEQIQFCVVPARARACTPPQTLAFPGEGHGRSQVSVLLPAPGMVDVVVPREVGPLTHGTYLRRSTDGGQTFGPPVRLSTSLAETAVPGPGGRIATAGGPSALQVNVVPPDGSAVRSDGARLGGLLGAQFNDIAGSGEEVFAAGSDTQQTIAFRLPPGADPDQEASWQPLPAPEGREPKLAGGPKGLVALMESTGTPPESLFVQRFEGAAWSPRVPVLANLNNDFDLEQNGGGRLTAMRLDFDTDRGYFIEYGTSVDGGTLWSSIVRVGYFGTEFATDLDVATAAGGRGIAASSDTTAPAEVSLTRFTPRSAPVARRRLRRVDARVQVRQVCGTSGLALVVEAARGNRQIRPGSVLRRARFGRARGARRGFRTRFRARYVLRRSRARIPVRVIPRRGKARTLRLRARRCR
jgi:hypothetical protein